MAVALVVAVLAAFVVALVLDIGSGGGGPPGKVEDVDVGSTGQHTEAAVNYEQSPPAGVSVIVVDAPPGGGPRLHRHPYEEVFVVQEGSATFTAGEDVIEARGGQVVVVPAWRTSSSTPGPGGCGRSTYTPATISLPSGSNDRGFQSGRSTRPGRAASVADMAAARAANAKVRRGRGGSIAFESGPAANHNVLTHKDIFNSDVGSSEGARVAMSVGHLMDRCN